MSKFKHKQILDWISDPLQTTNSSSILFIQSPRLLDELERGPEPLRPLARQRVPERVPRERLLQRARHPRSITSTRLTFAHDDNVDDLFFDFTFRVVTTLSLKTLQILGNRLFC